MPTVSIIVPNYNHARFLPKRLESIFRQTYQDFEVILLDDCSTDDSRSILSQRAGDPRVRVEFNETNSGSSFKQWNRGMRLARGEYVWIAESDDYADERLLERLVPLLEGDPMVALAYCRSWRVSESDQKTGFGDSYLDHLDSKRWASDFSVDGREECGNYFVFANPIPNASAVLFRRAGYQLVGGADETFRLCGDWKFWAALALTGRIAYVSEPLNYFRDHSSSMRSKTARLAEDKVEYIRVAGWVLSQLTATDSSLADSSLEKLREYHANTWIPMVVSGGVPLRFKRAIWQALKPIEPHRLRRLWRPALAAIRLKIGLTLAKSPLWRWLRGRSVDAEIS